MNLAGCCVQVFGSVFYWLNVSGPLKPRIADRPYSLFLRSFAAPTKIAPSNNQISKRDICLRISKLLAAGLFVPTCTSFQIYALLRSFGKWRVTLHQTMYQSCDRFCCTRRDFFKSNIHSKPFSQMREARVFRPLRDTLIPINLTANSKYFVAIATGTSFPKGSYRNQSHRFLSSEKVSSIRPARLVIKKQKDICIFTPQIFQG